MGRLTRQPIAQLEDKVAPPIAGYAAFHAKRGIASNGGIMRCPPVAVARWRRSESLARVTADTCAVTHYAPVCQWSCVIINSVVSVLLQGETLDLSKLLAAAKADGCPDLLTVAQEAGIPSSLLIDAVGMRWLGYFRTRPSGPSPLCRRRGPLARFSSPRSCRRPECLGRRCRRGVT